MTSYMRDKISQAMSRSSSDSSNAEESSKYRLRVTAGPSYNLADHKTVHVNTETPTYVENEFIRAKIQVRVRGFCGLPTSCPSTSEYFADPMHAKDQYSVAFSFVPKKDIPSANTVWGNDLDHPVRDRIPPGFNTAFRIVKEFIDPGLSCDVYADEPWLYGPSLSCWFGFRIGDKIADDEDFDAPGVLTEGSDGSGWAVREKHNLPSNNEKRRKHFLSAQNRQPFIFEKGRQYSGDFYNPYIDFGSYSLKLPGFSLKVLKYIGEKTHCLRYVFKDRQSGDVFFNVNMTLLWGDELQKALGKEECKEEAVEDEEDETYFDVENGEVEEPKMSEQAKAGAPQEMALHPGDHGAAAEKVRADASVDEIDELLRKTSTRQQRRGVLVDDDDVD